MSSSTVSSPCRIELGPSRWLSAALLGLGLAAIAALFLSGLPPTLRLIAAFAAGGHALILAWRELRRPLAVFTWPGGAAPARIESSSSACEFTVVAVRLRGPLAVLVLRGPARRLRRRLLWPDVLAVSDRRALRLVATLASDSPSALPLLAG